MDVAWIGGHFNVMNVILEYFTYHMIDNDGQDINVSFGIDG